MFGSQPSFEFFPGGAGLAALHGKDCVYVPLRLLQVLPKHWVLLAGTLVPPPASHRLQSVLGNVTSPSACVAQTLPPSIKPCWLCG